MGKENKMTIAGSRNYNKGCWGRWCARLQRKRKNLKVEINQMKTNAENTIRLINGDSAPDKIVDPVYSLAVLALGLQGRNERMEEFIKETGNSNSYRQWCNSRIEKMRNDKGL